MADKIIVDFEALDRISSRLNAAGRELDQVVSQLARLHVTRDAGADVRISGCGTKLRITGMTVSAGTVGDAVSSYKSAVGNVSWYTNNLGAAVQSIFEMFERTENNLSGKKLGTGESAPTSKGTESEASGSSWWDVFVKQLEGIKNEEDFLSLVKTLLGGYKSLDGIAEAGVLKDVISYIESFSNFFLGDKKGLTGASDWCDLANSSFGVWTGLYDYYSDKYKGFETGFFGKVAQKNVKILGLSAGFLGLTSSVLSASNGLDEKKWQSIVADYVDCGKDIFTIVKSGYGLKHISDAKSLLKIKAGPWNAFSVYTTIGEAGVRVVSQGFRSHEKYYADGKWDLGDTAATGIDIGMAGIYGISHSLTFGLDDLIFGAIDKANGGSGNSDMPYYEKAAEGYKFLAKKSGEAIGNWWINLTKKRT